MTDSKPLYNSRITKTYLEYLRNYYPDINIDPILEYAQITKHEVQDPAHWFTQQQTDRFQEALAKTTGNPNIAREAGRFTASSQGLGPARQHLLGFMKPMTVYLLMEKLGPLLSRSLRITTKKAGPTAVEVVCAPKPSVQEKVYQCENRIGVFESLARFFTDTLANVDHPMCYHRGDSYCRYIISWKKSRALVFRLLRNYTALIGSILSLALFPFMTITAWGCLFLFLAFVVMLFSFYGTLHEKSELSRTIKIQGDAAKALLDEMNIRHNNAQLHQEIGQSCAAILDIKKLVETVADKMQAHLDFDRGLIMLTNKEKTRLLYSVGYGYDEKKEALLQETEFRLDNPESRGIFTIAYKEQKSFLINNISEIEKDLSAKSLAFAKEMGVQSLICVPITYEKKSLGILAVDNLVSKRPLTQSDMSFLRGIASQTAISIINARSFQHIRKSEKKYRDLVENANSIIMRRNIKGNITFFNEFAQKFFGYGEDEIIGKNIVGSILPDTKEVIHEMVNLLTTLKMDPEKPVVSENEHLLKSGETAWIAWTYKPIFINSHKFDEILCIGNDITELKKAERAKRELENQLGRAQKMEAIGTLAGGVAHDLNNILSGIVSYPELLLMDLPEDSPLRKPILTIQKSGEKAAAIVQDLLTLARRGVAYTDVVNLNLIVTDYLNSPEHEKLRLLHPQVELETQLEENLMNILGSPVHLSKSLMNIVYNAAEASPKGGKIVISTQNVYIDAPVYKYESVHEGDYVVLNVKDTGTGIPKKDLGRIFEPFYSKKVMGKSGTGLGMAVIWGTVKDHHGYIDVNSTEGVGTQVTLYLPATRQLLSGNTHPISEGSSMGNGESILIIDDVAEQRDIASQMLTKLNYSVSAVSSGEEAIDYLKNQSVDLLLLDMIMNPGMDGLETYKNILEIHPGQKAIIVSGFSESGRVKRVQQLGAGSYVRKPYRMETIAQVIKKELVK